MQQQHISAPSSRVEALKAKHKSLSNKIDDELKRPFVSEYQVSSLKREKLKLKEEIEGIRHAS